MNWLSRFLHIKPASRTLCYQVGRGKVRQDLVRLLRDWQRFGIQDVSVDRESNSISARVDKSNRKFSPPSSHYVFSKWYLQGWQFEIEVLKTDRVLRCNAAFVSFRYQSSRSN
jgi:serine/threonine-protein kinase HSL1 (negative regulator of Swe1 kinase)